MSSKSFTISDSLHQYLLDASLRDHPVLAELRKVTLADPMARMQISPEQGQFMALLVKLMGAKKVSGSRRVHGLQLALRGHGPARGRPYRRLRRE